MELAITPALEEALERMREGFIEAADTAPDPYTAESVVAIGQRMSDAIRREYLTRDYCDG